MSDDIVLSSRAYRELLVQLRDAENYGKDADKELATLRDRLQAVEKERDELRFKLKTYAMFRLRCDKCGDLFNENHQGESCPGALYKDCTGTLQFNLPKEALQPAQKEQ